MLNLFLAKEKEKEKEKENEKEKGKILIRVLGCNFSVIKYLNFDMFTYNVIFTL